MGTAIEILMLAVGIYVHTVNSDISLGSCSLSCNEENNVLKRNHSNMVVGFPGKAGPEGRVGPRGLPGQKGDPGLCDCGENKRLADEVTALKQLEEILKGRTFVKNCIEAKKIVKTSGVTVIFPFEPTTNGIHVYCNQDVDGGGWIVVQRRVGGPVDFFRGWDDYERGFGNKEGDFWLGLHNIYMLTKNERYELRVDLEDHSDNEGYAKYSSFRLGGAEENYKLYVSGYTGNAGDGLLFHNRLSFTTKDKDNDLHPSVNCASHHQGAWWYRSCHKSNLNGVYGGSASTARGVSWLPWKNTHESLKTAEMKIRRVD